MRTAINQTHEQPACSGFFFRIKARHSLYLCVAGIIFIYRSCLTAASVVIGVATYLMYAINRHSRARAEADRERIRLSRDLIQNQQMIIDDLRKELAMSASKLAQTSRDYEEAKERLRETQQKLQVSETRLHHYTEADKEKLDNRLLQIQKMESVGRLAGGLAHDFNNLLSIMLGHAEIGLEDPSIQGLPVHNTLTQILKAGERVHTLTRQLLAFGRKQALKREALNLNHIILDFQPMLARLMGEAIEIITHLAHDPWHVFMDITQTEQILLNMAVNARDAMPQGGRLTISTANIHAREPLSADASLSPGEYVELSISDTGCGIEQDVLTHVFEPFFTTKEHGKGTGLGLSIVYEIVKQHGGGILAQSSPGHGATFKIFLPRHADDGTREKPRVNGYACNFSRLETTLTADAESTS